MDENRSPSDEGDAEAGAPNSVDERILDRELPGVGAEGIGTFSLSDFTDEGALVVSFYPFDFSPVCTEQLCGFRDADWLTFTEGVDVVAISVDSAYSHQQFREEYSLNFPLLTDRLASVADCFGVKYEQWENHPAVCQRAIFAIDDSHTIRYSWQREDANEQPSLEELEESIAWLR